MRVLSVADVEYIAYDLAKKLMEYDEPIPDFMFCSFQLFALFGIKDNCFCHLQKDQI